ncbi:hypothetical protein D8S78_11665 [Natrialba swarupiae]|nr:hypothetical protein [Natrialba swarupiae]
MDPIPTTVLGTLIAIGHAPRVEDTTTTRVAAKPITSRRSPSQFVRTAMSCSGRSQVGEGSTGNQSSQTVSVVPDRISRPRPYQSSQTVSVVPDRISRPRPYQSSQTVSVVPDRISRPRSYQSSQIVSLEENTVSYW